MGQDSKIEWTHATFNPWIGCAKVSPGCAHCYAEEMMDHRYGRVEWGPNGTRSRTSASNWKQPLGWDREAKADGVRRRVFCASLADVFEDRVELEAWRDDLFALIGRTPNLDWLLLTKRPENALRMVPWAADGLGAHRWPNVWIGASVEDQAAADERIPNLLAIPAAVRFLSVHRESWPAERVSNFWVIVGAESGRGARPMDEDWVRSIRDQCREAGVPLFYKQRLDARGHKVSLPELDGHRWVEFPAGRSPG
jgi:protein gp37